MKLAERQDKDLAFMLKFENVAWYSDGKVSILDRRVYPLEIRHVICNSYQEVSKSIKDMVTQSEGPYTAAAMGMVLAFYECKNKEKNEIKSFMNEAAVSLSTARPTTTEQMKRIVNGSLDILNKSLLSNESTEIILDKLFEYAYNYINNNYRKYTIIGKNFAELIPDNGTIMTQCFAGTVIGTMLRECKRMNKNIKVICAETRPYYQGARLTASVAKDMGFDVTVITDNMPGYVLKDKKVDIFTSASDVITLDGHVVNKIGTFQIALAAKYHNIPFYVTGTPDLYHKTVDSINIEYRDPNLVIESFGKKTVMDGVKGLYPAFDITPPELITGIVTDKGVLSPLELEKYFED